MRKLTVFNQITLDGYFADVNGDISWAKKHTHDAEWDRFVADNATGGDTLVFGRVTYQMMMSYWPTPAAREGNPVVADRMNTMPKVVFSRTLVKAGWTNTTLVKSDPAAELRRLKAQPGGGIAILGSGSLVAQLAHAGVIDEYQIVVNPVILGRGRTLFDGMKGTLALKRTRERAFANGNVLLCYAPIE